MFGSKKDHSLERIRDLEGQAEKLQYELDNVKEKYDQLSERLSSWEEKNTERFEHLKELLSEFRNSKLKFRKSYKDFSITFLDDQKAPFFFLFMSDDSLSYEKIEKMEDGLNLRVVSHGAFDLISEKLSSAVNDYFLCLVSNKLGLTEFPHVGGDEFMPPRFESEEFFLEELSSQDLEDFEIDTIFTKHCDYFAASSKSRLLKDHFLSGLDKIKSRMKSLHVKQPSLNQEGERTDGDEFIFDEDRIARLVQLSEKIIEQRRSRMSPEEIFWEDLISDIKDCFRKKDWQSLDHLKIKVIAGFPNS
jgi:hypothetical protein